MAAKDSKGRSGGITIIKKEEVVEGGHHGGAWKVAYADFVTAMMAFFLLMWLLNATTEAQRKGLADYFAPSNLLSRSMSGAGMPLGGKSAFEQGAMRSDKGAQTLILGRSPPPPEEEAEGEAPVQPGTAVNGMAGKPTEAHGNADPAVDQTGEHLPGGGVAPAQSPTPSRAEYLASAGAGTEKPDPSATDSGALRKAHMQQERAAFDQAAQQIREAIRNDPSLAGLARQLAIDLTPEGLRIQMLDEDRQPMFASGSVIPNDRAQQLLGKIAPTLARLQGAISIAGHTDAAPYKGGERSNWELSGERANATRRLLVEAGLPEGRFREVTAHADRDLLLPADPLAAANRRIAIVVLRAFPPK